MDASARHDDRPPAYATDGGDEDGATPLQEVAAGAVTALTLLVAFGLLFAGVEFFWVAFPVGFGGVLPAAVALARWYESRRGRETRRERGRERTAGAADDALATLRDRYARGDIDEAEFERRLDALLRTESVDEARATVERRAAERTPEREREPDPERDPTGGTPERERERER